MSRFDRLNIIPLVAILTFGFVIPAGFWLGYGTRQQIISDLRDFAFFVAGVLVSLFAVFAMLVIWSRITGNRKEKRMLKERGEQSPLDFQQLFGTSEEREIARLLYPILQSYTITRRVPFVRNDALFQNPLDADPEEFADNIDALCMELDVHPALNKDIETRLNTSRTVGELVNSLAALLSEQKNVGDFNR